MRRATSPARARCAWSLDRDTPYVPSPLLYDGILYFLKTNNGFLTALDTATGKPHYQAQRIDAIPNVFASPVGAAGRVYIPGREGATVVLKHGSEARDTRRQSNLMTASTRHRRWWTERSICAGIDIFIASPSESAARGITCLST